MDREKIRLVVLISGTGSNMDALLQATKNGKLNAEIVAVISNKASAKGLVTAADAGIATAVVDHSEYPDRTSFDMALAKVIHEYEPDLVILAGFMRILTPDFVQQFTGRLLNIHPSLLPKYPGLNTHQRAIEAGDIEAGATVHFVTPELDGGPPIAHAKVSVEQGDSANTLAARVLRQEHRLYPYVVNLFCDGRLRLVDDRAFLDGSLIPPNGIELSSC